MNWNIVIIWKAWLNLPQYLPEDLHTMHKNIVGNSNDVYPKLNSLLSLKMECTLTKLTVVLTHWSLNSLSLSLSWYAHLWVKIHLDTCVTFHFQQLLNSVPFHFLISYPLFTGSHSLFHLRCLHIFCSKIFCCLS